MNMQELSTIVQYKLPIKIFILNNEWMGMVRQWQELLHGKNYSESYTEALPDFVKLAEALVAASVIAPCDAIALSVIQNSPNISLRFPLG